MTILFFMQRLWEKKRVLPAPYPPMRVAEGPVFFSVQPFFLWNFLPLTRQGKARFSVTKGLRKAETERSALHFCRIFFRFLCRSGLCIIPKRRCAVIEWQKRAFPQAIEILQSRGRQSMGIKGPKIRMIVLQQRTGVRYMKKRDAKETNRRETA